MKTKTALAYFGNNASELARALKIKPQAPHQWGDEVPRLRAFELQQLTNGALKVDEPETDSSSQAA